MKTSFRRTSCEDCADLIEEGEPIYFTDDGKICQTCARRDHLVCPACQSQKKPQYQQCYGCGPGESGKIRSKSKSDSDSDSSGGAGKAVSRKFKAGKRGKRRDDIIG